jgi:hypothetical protein
MGGGHMEVQGFPTRQKKLIPYPSRKLQELIKRPLSIRANNSLCPGVYFICISDLDVRTRLEINFGCRISKHGKETRGEKKKKKRTALKATSQQPWRVSHLLCFFAQAYSSV